MEWMEELEGEGKNNVEVGRSCRAICPANGCLCSSGLVMSGDRFWTRHFIVTRGSH